MDNTENNRRQADSRVQGAVNGNSSLHTNGRSRAIAAAEGKTICEIGGYMAIMSNLLLDVIDGTVDAKRANAACNVADKLLKAVELRMRLKKESVGVTESEVLRVVRYLDTHENIAKPAIIAADLGLDIETANEILRDARFERTPIGVRVAKNSR